MEDKDLDELLKRITADLECWKGKSGDVFYSGRSTLVQGDFYLMGLNPGGNLEKEPHPLTIADSLKNWRNKSESWSEYECERWKRGEILLGPGEAQHQKNVVYLCNEVLKRDVRSVFSANAVFLRTPTAGGLPEDEVDNGLYSKCWQVHKRLISIIQPGVIVCIGNGVGGYNSSSFKLIAQWLKIEQEPKAQSRRCGKRIASVRSFDKPITICPEEGGQTIRCGVIGVPHPSRYWYPQIENFEETIQDIFKKWSLDFSELHKS